MQDKQKAQQERVYDLAEQVAELEGRQESLKRALDSCRQVSNSWTCAAVSDMLCEARPLVHSACQSLSSCILHVDSGCFWFLADLKECPRAS